jgi:D-glycero-D-manno-heptose 1,7-bisphosphate phosphatase
MRVSPILPRTITARILEQTREFRNKPVLLLDKLHAVFSIRVPITGQVERKTGMVQEHTTSVRWLKLKMCGPQLYRPPQSRLNATCIVDAPRRAVFLDRDGTIVEDVGYLTAPSQLKLLPDAIDGIRLLQDQFLIVIVTNQSAVARGLLDEDGLFQIHQALARALQNQGAFLDAIYTCPHHPSSGIPPYKGECRCRKPQPGMLLQAMKDFDIKPSLSFMIGDKGSDILAGRLAGVAATVLVQSPKTEAMTMHRNVATYVSSNLHEAARLVLDHWSVMQLSAKSPATLSQTGPAVGSHA